MKIVEICKGLSVKRGDDGHWITFSSGGKIASINVENKFHSGTIVHGAIMNWVAEVLSEVEES